MRIVRGLLLAAVLALFARPAAAQVAIVEFDRTTNRGVLDLLREVFPDMTFRGKATRYTGVRAVSGAVDQDTDQPATGDFDLAAAGATWGVVRDGHSDTFYNAVLAGDVLVVGQVEPTYRFGDAINVRTDPGGPPSIYRLYLLAPGVPAVMVRNAHHNSQEGFESYLLLALLGGKLVEVYYGPSLYSVSRATASCDDAREIQRLVKFEAMESRRDGMADMRFEVLAESECRGDRTTPSGDRTSTRLRWSASQRKYLSVR
jgi:hypothetical protein